MKDECGIVEFRSFSSWAYPGTPYLSLLLRFSAGRFPAFQQLISETEPSIKHKPAFLLTAEPPIFPRFSGLMLYDLLGLGIGLALG